MASPKDILTRVLAVTTAWANLRPAKSFSGQTLDQFRETVKPSLDVRAEITDLEGRLQAAVLRRDALDAVSMATVNSIVHGVKGDMEEGEDGELYAAMGFVRKSLRSSGLMRRQPKDQVKSNGAA